MLRPERHLLTRGLFASAIISAVIALLRLVTIPQPGCADGIRALSVATVREFASTWSLPDWIPGGKSLGRFFFGSGLVKSLDLELATRG
jgi:hypothetical protein